MREIKYRGQDEMTGQWVYGDLIHGVGSKNGKVYILPRVVNLAHIKNCHPLDGVEVDPKTVGQYTGLKDKNGVDVFEHDIADNNWVIKWNNLHNCWGYYCLLGYYKRDILSQMYDAKAKVVHPYIPFAIIGNIHDTPELLNT